MMGQLLTRYRLIGLAFAAIITVIDQIVKWYVIGPLQLRSVGNIHLLSFFDLTYVENRGMSLGMFQATSMEARWTLVLITAAIALVVLVWMMREKLLGDILGLGMILGGAIGNIIDRYTLGYVIDYADFHVSWIPAQLCPNFTDGVCRPFLVFNVADAAITIGVVIILARSLFMREKEDDEPDAEAPSDGVPSEN